MAEFPTLKSGAVAQYPLVRELRRDTDVLRFIDGAEQRYRGGETVRRWVIRLDRVDEEELAAIERLFEETQGRAGSFSFRDPWDGSTYQDCSFEEDDFTERRRGEGLGEAVLIIRENRS